LSLAKNKIKKKKNPNKYKTKTKKLYNISICNPTILACEMKATGNY
jgi:hypothetical protein